MRKALCGSHKLDYTFKVESFSIGMGHTRHRKSEKRSIEQQGLVCSATAL